MRRTMAKNRTAIGNSVSHHLADLREHAETVGDEVKAMAATVGSAARHKLDPIEKFIRQHPSKSILYAVGIGALLTLLVRRR